MKKLKKMLPTKEKRENINSEEYCVQYIHPHQIDGMVENTDEIIRQLNAAIVIAGKMKANSCEVERFKIYKKMFHELWIGIAEHYNYVNGVDVNKCSDGKYIV